MRRKKTIYLFTLVAELLLSSSVAYNQINPKMFQFKRRTNKSLTVPFQFINNLIVISLKINNSDTLRFILDSGLNNTLLLDFPDSLKSTMQLGRKIEIYGIGNGPPLEAIHSFENEITIGGITANHQDICIIEHNVTGISNKLGMRIHGLIGYSLFKDFIIHIDYERSQVTFYRPEKYKYRLRRKSMVFSLHIENNKPYINFPVSIVKDKPIQAKLLIDTGASYPLWLLLSTNDSIILPAKFINTYLGAGLGGDLYGAVGKIYQIEIRDHVLKNIFTAFPDSSLLRTTLNNDDRNGSIGEEILRRFDIILDYRNEKMVLRPNHHFREEFRYNMSGIEVIAQVPELPIYTISTITDNSPGSRCGLQVGDRILEINREKTLNMKLSEITNILQQKKGKKVKLKIARDGDLITTTLILNQDI
jgi:hypothetical protein